MKTFCLHRKTFCLHRSAKHLQSELTDGRATCRVGGDKRSNSTVAGRTSGEVVAYLTGCKVKVGPCSKLHAEAFAKSMFQTC